MQILTGVLPFLVVAGVNAQRPGFKITPVSSTAAAQATTTTSTAVAGRPGFKVVPVTTTSLTSSSVKPSTTSTSTSTSIKSTLSTTTTTTSTKPPTTSSTSTTLATSTKPVTTTSTSSAPACTSTLAQYGCLPLTNQAVFVQSMLDQHNTYRMRHNAPNMTWSSDLVPSALANAQNNADNNVFVHTANNPNGENIAYQYGYNNPQYLGFLWYDEERQYDFATGGFSDATGHFTQLVWLSSTHLGCAYVQAKNTLSNNGYYYLSCEYSPPGNYAGEYQQQVLPANSQPYPTQPPMWL